MPNEEICLKESTPVGTLGIIPLESCKELGAKVNNYLNPILNELGIQVPADNASINRILTEQFVPKGDGVWKSLIASAKFGGTAVLTWAWNLILIPVVLF